MEAKFRINNDLYTRIREAKHSTIDKTMYAKKLGFIHFLSKDIVIDVSDNESEAIKKVNKFLCDFFINDEQRKNNKEKIKYIKDTLKHEFLIVCDKDLYVEKSGIKFIDENDFKESTQFIDDNHAPLKINFTHLGKVLTEQNIRTKGSDSVFKTENYETIKKDKLTLGEIIQGFFKMIPAMVNYKN